MDVVTRLDRGPAWLADVLLAGLIVAVGLLTTGDADALHEPRDALGLALVLVATVPYVARRLAPLPVFVVSALATTALMLRHYDAGALPMVLLLGAATVGAHRPATEVLTAGVLIESLLGVLFVADVPTFELGDLATSAVAFPAALALGWTLQVRRRRIEHFDVERVEATRQAAADERLRIAQELHDVVAHSLGVIAVQAGAGLQVLDRDREQARVALEHVSTVSRSALTEIRWLLGRVRDTERSGGYAPTPTIEDLAGLAGDVRTAGPAVDVEVDGDSSQVPPGVGLAAYRITQEALTNTLRHAGAGAVRVRVEIRPEAVEIDVVDDGRGGAPAPGGHGLVGMQERAAVYGGTVDAGPGPGGGFRVHARLPYGGR